MTKFGLSWQRCAAAVLAVSALSVKAHAQACADWLPGMGMPGVNGLVSGSMMWDPDGPGPGPARLVITGSFTVAGDALANNIAMWDPATGEWSALGSGINNAAAAMTTGPDGSLIVGGVFTIAGGQPASRIARWDGAGWSAMGAGLDDVVIALVTMPSGDIIAGGIFDHSGQTPVNRVARWDGTEWNPLGAGVSMADGSASDVSALAVLPTGELAVGGLFNRAGGGVVSNVARWTGAAWAAMGTGVTGEVNDFEFWDSDGAGPLPTTLVAGGARVTSWNGTTWSLLSPVSVPGTIDELIARPNGELVAIGNGAPYISKRGPSSWLALGGGLNLPAASLTNLPDGRLFVGGMFELAGAPTGIGVANAAIWNNASWERIAHGCDWPIDCVTATADGGMIVGGSFRTIGHGLDAGRIARWNGVEWSTFGAGVTEVHGFVQAVLELENGDVIAGGGFTTIDGVSARGIARWDGAAWHALGSGLGGSALALAKLHNGDIVAGGVFESAGGMPAARVARWDGAAWNAMGSGINGQVHDLSVGPSGDLFVAADHIIGPAVFVMRWDGAAWTPFGGGFNGEVRTVAALPGGGVVVGGNFTTAGGVPAARVARWNGTQWQAMGPGMTQPVEHLIVLADGSILAGTRYQPGVGEPEEALSRWDGAAWQRVGSGIERFTWGVYQLAQLANGEIVAVGDIESAGGHCSANLARFSYTGRPEVAISPADTEVIVGNTLMLTATPRAGFEGVSVQWMRNGKPISNGPGGASPGGGLVSGASGPLESPTDGVPALLIVEQTRASDAGEYSAVFSNACGESTSTAADVVIDIGDCATDFNNDGTANSTDVSDFINAWMTDLAKGSLTTDWNSDGVVNGSDVSEFIDDWFFETLSGCGG